MLLPSGWVVARVYLLPPAIAHQPPTHRAGTGVDIMTALRIISVALQGIPRVRTRIVSRRSGRDAPCTERIRSMHPPRLAESEHVPATVRFTAIPLVAWRDQPALLEPWDVALKNGTRTAPQARRGGPHIGARTLSYVAGVSGLPPADAPARRSTSATWDDFALAYGSKSRCRSASLIFSS